MNFPFFFVSSASIILFPWSMMFANHCINFLFSILTDFETYSEISKVKFYSDFEEIMLIFMFFNFKFLLHWYEIYRLSSVMIYVWTKLKMNEVMLSLDRLDFDYVIIGNCVRFCWLSLISSIAKLICDYYRSVNWCWFLDP